MGSPVFVVVPPAFHVVWKPETGKCFNAQSVQVVRSGANQLIKGMMTEEEAQPRILAPILGCFGKDGPCYKVRMPCWGMVVESETTWNFEDALHCRGRWQRLRSFEGLKEMWYALIVGTWRAMQMIGCCVVVDR